MDDNIEKYLSIEKNKLQNYINDAYSDIINNLKNGIKELDKELDSASKKRKIEIQKEIKEKTRALEEINEKKKKYEDQIDEQARKNVFSNERLQLNSLEKIHVNKILLEEKFNKAVESALSARSEEEKKIAEMALNAVNEELDALKKKEASIKKTLEYEEKRAQDVENIKKLQNKANKLAEFGEKKAAKQIELEKKKLEIQQKEADLNEKLESGDITKEEFKKASGEISSLKADVNYAEKQAKFIEEVKKLPSTIGGIVKDFINFSNRINVAIDDVISHRTKIMARLQGYGGEEYDYDNLFHTMAKNLATSPYVSQKKYMERLDEAVAKGIAYNVEQRAFLDTVKDEIATTFDAFDSNLMRIIRLQQADSTAARLGMEAALTKTLNSVFSDTSYLSDMYDTITGAIVESESLMSRSAATEFEYVVQKWMGALYSLGASQSLISQIAQGINYLGTGNVQALASNSPLQTLFAMSASRAGDLDYAQMLVEGLDASNTNKLLKSMVQYLKEIAIDNKNNNVVKAAYGDLYQMSLADMRAITSLTEGDISSIYSQNLSYENMKTELSNQFNNISKRLSMPEMINNILDNFTYTLGSEIANNAVEYTMWQITDLIQKETGGIHLPAISIFGNMVDLSSFTIEGIMKTGIVGMATLGQIGNILSSIGNAGRLNQDAWGYRDTLSRGQIQETKSGSITSTSGSTYVGSSSSSDIKKSSLSGAMDESSDVAEITSSGHEDDYTINDLYIALYEKKEPIPIYMDDSFGIGKLLRELIEMLYKVDRIQNVNIKSSDVKLSVSVSDIESKLREAIKNYIKTNYVEILADEMKSALIGNTRGSATIAKVCDKIMNDTVDVEIKNNGIDMVLNRLGSFGIF